MAAVTGLTSIKRFTYRGDTQEEFSNTYHFKGPPPGDDASWNVLVNDLFLLEKWVFPTVVEFVRYYGYDSDDPNADHVYQKDNTIPGPPPVGSMANPVLPMAGDQAAMVWWKTGRKNSRGKPIYLRKYLHSGGLSSSDRDGLEPGYVGMLGQYADGLVTLHGGLRSLTHDENIIAHGVSPFVTTRTLKRRGKRPKTSS